MIDASNGGHIWASRFDRYLTDIFAVQDELTQEIGDGKIKPRFHLAVGIFGKTDGAGLGNSLQPRGDIDAVAHQVAVVFLDHISQMD
ncbi:hypothetical protein AB9F45_36160, partial [Rhizobium leguminosarum]|uniref:hypothetical protein n=1 Tax=Rhizobium leguminosarum TaxID=384 RepID=UPI003F95AB68